MTNLINISQTSFGGEAVQTVNARDLYDFLELSRDFNQWMREQIERARLIEGRDWVSYDNVVNRSGGRPRKEYAITVEAGKHIGMMSGSDKGFEIRDYFIECERQVKAVTDPMEMLNDPTVLRQALLGYSEKVIALESQVQEQAPKVQAYERIADATGSMSLRETATTLKYPERKMIVWMQQNGWLYRRPGRGTLLGYAEKIKAGYLDHKVTLIHNDRTGEDETRESVRVTPLGLTVLAKRLDTDIVPVPPISGFGSPPPQSYAQIRG